MFTFFNANSRIYPTTCDVVVFVTSVEKYLIFGKVQLVIVEVQLVIVVTEILPMYCQELLLEQFGSFSMATASPVKFKYSEIILNYFSIFSSASEIITSGQNNFCV